MCKSKKTEMHESEKNSSNSKSSSKVGSLKYCEVGLNAGVVCTDLLHRVLELLELNKKNKIGVDICKIFV